MNKTLKTTFSHGLVATLLAVAAAASLPALAAAAAGPADHAAAPLAQIRDSAMASDWAYERLTELTDQIGPRLAGSPGAEAAVEHVATAMRALGAKVTLQPVTVPRWVRGVETGELVAYSGRPAGVTQRVVLAALGGSGATPAAGLTAPVVIVRSVEELQAKAGQVKGSIVLFDVPFDQHMADSGLAMEAYIEASRLRSSGPAQAAKLGAVAALVRSIGGAGYRIAHVGATALRDAQRIPAAAVTVEDALLIGRLAARGPLSMHLTLTPQSLGDTVSYNVIADLPGSDKADEVVIVSGHLDSWDLGTGANDDGTGVTSAMAVIETLKKLKLQPRRTIRVVAWMNEESGATGSRAYFEANKGDLVRHVAAIESDLGSGRPLGVLASVGLPAEKAFAPLRAALLPLGAGALSRRDRLSTGDLALLQRAGVPCFQPLVDSRHYFNYHHSAADTLDKVAPDNLRRHVALMSTLAWLLANTDEPIGRAPSQL